MAFIMPKYLKKYGKVYGSILEKYFCISGLQQNVKFTDERWEKPFNKCMFALSILRESLDFEKGGEVATNLDSLYAFSQKTMLKAVGKSDPENINIVLTIIRDLSSAWDEIRPLAR